MGGNFIVSFLHIGLFLIYSFIQCISLFEKNFSVKRILYRNKNYSCMCVWSG